MLKRHLPTDLLTMIINQIVPGGSQLDALTRIHLYIKIFWKYIVSIEVDDAS